jgi:hypothetical protein
VDQTRPVRVPLICADRLGILFFDLSRLPFTADGRYFIDASHTTESGALATLLALADEPRFVNLFPAIEKDRLRADLERATGSGKFAQVYPYR